MAITIKDIAKEVGVSATTVSLAINGQSKQSRISGDTRKKIMNAIAKTGYVPNLYARSIRKGSTSTIGMIFPDMSYTQNLSTKGANIVAVKNDFNTIIGISYGDIKREQSYINNFLSRRVDGIIFGGHPKPETLSILKNLYNDGFPLVIIGNTSVTGIDSASDDTEAAGYEATNHLLQLNHKRIAFCKGYCSENQYEHYSWIAAEAVRLRYHGYQTALRNNGIQTDEDLCINTKTNDYKGGQESAEKILKMEKKPDAMIFRNDEMALGALNFFLKTNVRVPQDISLVSIGGKPITEMALVPLTVVSYSTTEVGIKAVDMLLEKINKRKEKKQNSTSIQSLRISPQLIIRESTMKRTK